MQSKTKKKYTYAVPQSGSEQISSNSTRFISPRLFYENKLTELILGAESVNILFYL